MIERIVGFALAQRLMVCLAGLALLFGGLYAFTSLTWWPDDRYRN